MVPSLLALAAFAAVVALGSGGIRHGDNSGDVFVLFENFLSSEAGEQFERGGAPECFKCVETYLISCGGGIKSGVEEAKVLSDLV